MMLGNTHDETRAFIAPDSPKLLGLDWDNLAERMAPELRDRHRCPNGWSREYRGCFPAWTPERHLLRGDHGGAELARAR